MMYLDMLYKVQGVAHFTMTRAMEITEWVGDDYIPLYQNFVHNDCCQQMFVYFQEHIHPTIIVDNLDLLWLACHLTDSQYELLGPLISSQTSEAYLLKNRDKYLNSNPPQRYLIRLLQKVPVTSTSQIVNYARSLQYAITGEVVPTSAFDYIHPVTITVADWVTNTSNLHDSWDFEQQMCYNLQHGLDQPAPESYHGRSGVLCPGDPLRQMKTESLITATLLCRSAIAGGVSPEASYTLCDQIICAIEACADIKTLRPIMNDIYPRFLERVQLVKQSQHEPLLVSQIKDYVENHLVEKIDLQTMAASLGYTPYYLSAKFKSSYGISIKLYIQQRKIDWSKKLLRKPTYSVQDIANQLHFVSDSYYCSVFKKWTGQTPRQYQASITQNKD